MQSIEQRVTALEAKVAALTGTNPPSRPLAPLSQFRGKVDPRDIARCIAFIREAGTAGVPAATLRARHRFIRRAIASGNPLPSELAAAGVLTEKRGKGWWYYVPEWV